MGKRGTITNAKLDRIVADIAAGGLQVDIPRGMVTQILMIYVSLLPGKMPNIYLKIGFMLLVLFL